MIGKAIENKPRFCYIEKTEYITSGKTYDTHTLYNKTQNYYGGAGSGNSPTLGCVEEVKPTLYSLLNE